MPRDTKNLKLRGKVWWFRKRVKGKDIEEPLDTGNLGVAQERRDGWLRKLKEQGAVKFKDGIKRTINDAADKFGEEHYPTLKLKSRKRYTVSVANLLQVFDGMLMTEIGSARLDEFVQHRMKHGVKSPTIRRDLACLSVIFSKAEVWEWVDHNPVKPFLWSKGTSGLRDSEPRTRHLSHEEEPEVLMHAPRKSVKAIIFAIDTGLRKEEQFALQWPDVDLVAKEIFVRASTSKNSRARWVPILPRTLALLKEMHRNRDRRSAYVFTTEEGERYSPESPTMWEAVQKAVKRANKARAKAGRPPMEHLEWHDLRRTCGCRLLQDMGFSMEEVSKWLGHSSVKVTERHYAFLTKKELHRAVERSLERQQLQRAIERSERKVVLLPPPDSGQKSGHSLMRIRRRLQ